MEFIEIDGSHGEGGGQILRTAIALSAITQKPFKLTKIRAGRCNPGLQPQHMTAIKLVKDMCGAEVNGLEQNSLELEFIPGKIKSGSFKQDVGTAGLLALILQAALPVAIFAPEKVELELTGGTAGKFGFSVNYFQSIINYYLEKIGIEVYSEIIEHGFYPKGQGVIKLDINPIKKEDLQSLNLVEQGDIRKINFISIASEDLKVNNVAERQLEAAEKHLHEFKLKFGAKETSYVISSTCSFIQIACELENSMLGADIIGEKGIRAEEIGKKAAEVIKQELLSGACIDKNAADQLLIYMALNGNGRLKTSEITNHTLSNIFVIEQFLPVKFTLNSGEKIIECKLLV